MSILPAPRAHAVRSKESAVVPSPTPRWDDRLRSIFCCGARAVDEVGPHHGAANEDKTSPRLAEPSDRGSESSGPSELAQSLATISEAKRTEDALKDEAFLARMAKGVKLDLGTS